jgi:hypothetical protein
MSLRGQGARDMAGEPDFIFNYEDTHSILRNLFTCQWLREHIFAGQFQRGESPKVTGLLLFILKLFTGGKGSSSSPEKEID